MPPIRSRLAPPVWSRRVLGAAMLGTSLWACSGGTPTLESQPVLEALRVQVLALEEALNQAVDGLDCESGMAYMGDAEPLFVSAGQVIRTRDELHDMCIRMTEPRTGAEFSIDSRTANMLSPDAAVVVREGTYTIHFREQPSVALFLAMTTVWQREGETWKMVHLHESFPTPVPEG